jgi:small subunit ribosomal protein S8
MSMTDPVSDLFSRIRNAIVAKHESFEVPASKMKLEIVRILKEEGYVANYALNRDDAQGTIQIQLRYGPGKRAVISSLTRVSRPGCRVYAGKREVPVVLGGMGVCILSTSLGILTGKQAQEKGVGGEVLCAIS